MLGWMPTEGSSRTSAIRIPALARDSAVAAHAVARRRTEVARILAVTSKLFFGSCYVTRCYSQLDSRLKTNPPPVQRTETSPPLLGYGVSRLPASAGSPLTKHSSALASVRPVYDLIMTPARARTTMGDHRCQMVAAKSRCWCRQSPIRCPTILFSAPCRDDRIWLSVHALPTSSSVTRTPESNRA